MTRDDVIAEARTWLRTPHQHQQSAKGVGVDCTNFIQAVASAVGAITDPTFTSDYRRREDGRVMMLTLTRHMDFVQSFEDALPADVLALHNGETPDVPRHLAIVTQLEPYPQMIHASERGVVEHRIDGHFKSLIHSVWRIKGLD